MLHQEIEQSFVRGVMERRIAVPIRNIARGTAILQQVAGNGQLPRVARAVQRCLALIVVVVLGSGPIGVVRQNGLDSCQIASLDGAKEVVLCGHEDDDDDDDEKGWWLIMVYWSSVYWSSVFEW